jgi:hypothetical protein
MKILIIIIHLLNATILLTFIWLLNDTAHAHTRHTLNFLIKWRGVFYCSAILSLIAHE